MFILGQINLAAPRIDLINQYHHLQEAVAAADSQLLRRLCIRRQLVRLIRPSFCPSYPFVLTSIHPSCILHPSIRTSIHPAFPIHPSIVPSIYPSAVLLPIRSSFCPSIRPAFSIHPSVHPSIHPSILRSPIHPSVGPCIYPSVRPCVLHSSFCMCPLTYIYISAGRQWE